MRHLSILRRALLGALPLSLSAPAIAQTELFWVGGTQDWLNRFAWSATNGGPSGAGPPTSSDDANFPASLTTDFTAKFSGNGVAHKVVARSSGTFDLEGNTLSLAGKLIGQPPNTALIDSNFFVGTLNPSDTAKVTLTNGTGFSNLMHATGNGVTNITIAPDLVWTLSAVQTALPQPHVHVRGPAAEILVQGRLDLQEFSAPGFVYINDNARLTVSGGVFGNQGQMFIGNLESGGTFTVSNNGLASTDELIVGDIGNGNVVVRTSGNFGADEAIVGRAATGVGQVNVSGNLSTWQLTGPLTLGDEGRGALNISSSGHASKITSADTYLGRQSGGRGTLTIASNGRFTTAGSVYVGGDDTTSGGDGTITVQSGASMIVSDRLHLYPGRGTLSIDGARVSVGSLTMDSFGELRITNNGSLNANSVQLAPTVNSVDLISGAINVTGGVFDPGVGNFRFGDATSLFTIRLDDGARSDVVDWNIGSVAGGSAATRISNSRAAGGLFATGEIRVGGQNVSANGSLTITNGGRARANNNIFIGHASGSSGNVRVDGIGPDGRRSLLQSIASVPPNDGEIIVGHEGTGILDIRNGGLAQAFNNMSVGSMPGGTGTVTVGGMQLTSPATLRATNDLAVGGFATTATPGGDGLVEVLADGFVSVGNRTTVYADGVVRVHPDGLHESDELLIDGGVFELLGASEGGAPGLADISGNTTVTGAGAQVRLHGGTLRTAGLDLGAVPSRLDWQGGMLALTGTGSLIIGVGGPLGPNLQLNAAETLDVGGAIFIGDNGRVELAGGTLVSGEDVIVEDGSRVSGHGTIQMPVFFENSGELRPGSAGAMLPGGAAGAIHIEGTFSQVSSTGALFIDLGGATPGIDHDVVHVSQTADLGGELIVGTINDFTPLPGESFEVMTYGSRIGLFDSIANATGFAGLMIEPNYGSAALTLLMDALGGDANLDGLVNLSDFNRLAANFGMSGVNWLDGDFTGDGVVNLSDFNILAGNFGVSASAGGPTPDDWSGLASAVPEPGVAGLLGFPAALLLRRRRRR